ncbi:MAG: NUDIX domain-containing protein [Nocardioidaceae bacterium]
MPMSPYVSGVRAKLGTDLLLMPAVGTAVFDDDGRILLGLHVDTGMWATLGGAVDPGESPAQAARREQREEISETGWFTAEQVATLPMPADMAMMVPDAFAWWAARARKT